MRQILLIAILALLSQQTLAANWAVLVAGSHTYANYRHQADICHAYQTLVEKGVPKENIIVLATDDIAHNLFNPFKGQMFNKPSEGPGKDVYAGCVIDYSGIHVTPKNYLDVLMGDEEAVKGKGSGRVLKSTKDDHVFLNFADHGAPDLIAFPHSALHAKQLQEALTYMFKNNMYKRLVYYLESCESGSMFETLDKNMNIYAVSAASPDESSWGTYCPPQDKINGKSVGSCLGDLFSVNWLENTDSIDVSQVTLESQFETVAKLTDKSQVMQWGDTTWSSSKVGEFIGTMDNGSSFLKSVKQAISEQVIVSSESKVDSRYATLNFLTFRYLRNPNEQNKQQLEDELMSMKYFQEKFDFIENSFALITNFSENLQKQTDFNCYKDSMELFEEKCAKFTDFSLKFLKVLHKICKVAGIQESVYNKVLEVCQEQQ